MAQQSDGSGPDIPVVQGGIDNSRAKCFGGKACIWIDPGKEIGFSYYRSRWNSNSLGPSPHYLDHFDYWCAVVDVNFQFGGYHFITGEYIYSRWETPTGADFVQHGYYLEASARLGMFPDCMCMTECMADLLNSTYLVIRGSSVWTDFPDKTRQQLTPSIAYYMNSLAQLTMGVDFNWSDYEPFRRTAATIGTAAYF